MSPRHTTSEVRRNLIGRLARSRDFSISLILHLILIVLFGSRILFEAVKAPPEMSTGPEGICLPQANATPLPAPETPMPKLPEIFSPQSPAVPAREIISALQQPTEIALPTLPSFTPDQPALNPEARMTAPVPEAGKPSRAEAVSMADFRKDWVSKPGVGSREQEYQFTAYVGQYGRGDWNSTNTVTNNTVESGSLPNLLYFMSAFSNSKVKTNYQNVKAIRLGSDELFTEKPPFIFLTGTRDFELTPQEVENVREYLRLGGAIWGDSSVPGKNSRFDIAFRREMRRVIPDVNKGWEPLPSRHPIFTRAFFPEVRDVPPGLNSYREPVEVLKIHGEVAVIYTSNDYGNMWQIGLDKSGKVDLRRNEKGRLVATNELIWSNRDTYLRNLSPDSLLESYKFGTNLVIHLLNRWENVNSGASRL
ncbi:MAG: DUF4159 domain-containing protein [Terrimicrobiaceae bacterium]